MSFAESREECLDQYIFVSQCILNIGVSIIGQIVLENCKNLRRENLPCTLLGHRKR